MLGPSLRMRKKLDPPPGLWTYDVCKCSLIYNYIASTTKIGVACK